VLLVARVEAAFTPARRSLLAVACVPAALLGNTSPLVTAAAVAALGVRVLLKAEGGAYLACSAWRPPSPASTWQRWPGCCPPGTSPA
jgi:hypothetical protein